MGDKELNSVIDRAEDEYQKLKDKVVEQGLEIERLNKENKILRENAEHNDKVVDKVNWENKRLNNIINKGIEAINVYQNEKTLSIGYQDLKRIRGILRGNEFDLQMFEEYLQELKGSDK